MHRLAEMHTISRVANLLDCEDSLHGYDPLVHECEVVFTQTAAQRQVRVEGVVVAQDDAVARVLALHEALQPAELLLDQK